MGLFKNYVSQTRKPEGFLGKMMLAGGYFMICNESDGTDPASLKFEKIIDGMKNYTSEEIEAALRAVCLCPHRDRGLSAWVC